MTPPRPAATRRSRGATSAEILAARRVVSGAERQGVEDAEKLCQDARRVLEAATADAERILADARTESQRVRASAEQMLAEAGAEAKSILARARTAVAAATAVDPAVEREAHGDELERRRREAALSAVDPSAADVVVLRRLLSDDLAADVRLAAIGALARTSESDQLGALSVASADPDPRVRAGAVATLSVAGTSRAAPQVLAAAEDHDEAVRGAAWARLAAARSWVLWMALGRCSRRSELLAVLGEAATDRLAPLVLERVSSPDVADRVLAVELIGHLGTPALLDEAVQLLTDAQAAVRRAAASQLAGRDQAVTGLVGVLRDDPDPAARREAARSLADAGADAAVLAFLGALQDPEADVRRLAVEALVRRPSAGLARRLADELSIANLDSVGEVLVGMGPVGHEALAAAVADGPPERASAATELLRRTDPTPRLLADPYPSRTSSSEQ